jgi:hypothetical protein
MSEAIDWQALTPNERTRIVAEKVLNVIIPIGMALSKIPYATKLEPAIALLQYFVNDRHPGSSFEIWNEKTTMHVQIRLYPKDNGDLPVQRYNAHDYVLTDAICVALLRACGVEVITHPTGKGEQDNG